MNLDNRLRANETNLDERLRAAGRALREGSATQVDAAGGLREIVHAGRPPAVDPTVTPGQPVPATPANLLLRRTQRLALAVNLLLVVALGFALVLVAGGTRRAVESGAPAQRPARTSPSTSVPAASTVARPVVEVPPACLEAADLADEIISALTRNERDNRLATALRDYSIANQACRKEAAPPTTRPAAGG
jgi:hypothetical protein